MKMLINETAYRITFLILSFFLLTIIGCKSNALNKRDIGMDEQAFINRLNQPTHEKMILFTANTKLAEYQSNIYKLYPKLTSADTIKIKELIWIRNNDKTAVWFTYESKKWKAIDYLEWSQKTQY